MAPANRTASRYQPRRSALRVGMAQLRASIAGHSAATATWARCCRAAATSSSVARLSRRAHDSQRSSEQQKSWRRRSASTSEWWCARTRGTLQQARWCARTRWPMSRRTRSAISSTSSPRRCPPSAAKAHRPGRRWHPEVFTLQGKEIYLWSPEGLQNARVSKALTEKRLGVVATGRNWSTVEKLLELAEAGSA